MSSLTSTPNPGASSEDSEVAGPSSSAANLPLSSSTLSSPPPLPSSSIVQEATPLSQSLIIRQLISGLTPLRTLAGALVAAQAPAHVSSRNLRIPTALDLAIYGHLASVSALLQLASDTLPVADIPSVEQHQVGHTEETEPGLTREAEEAETGEAEIVLQECRICLDEKPINDFTRITGTCDEIPGACKECVQLWLEERLEGNTWKSVTCLSSGCDELLQHSDWQRLASSELFARYEYLVTKETLDANPDFRYCLNPECNSGQEHVGDPYDTLFVCYVCGYESCAMHNIPWHNNESCEEYELRINPAAQEEASLAEIARTTKKCPGRDEDGGVCGVSIMKNGGCAHMTCTQCEHEFCYFCLADWVENDTEHAENCEGAD